MDYCEDIFVLGDVHGDFRSLANLINRKHPRIVLQCGDFGYWPGFKVKYRRGVLKDSRPRIGETKLYWCEGNHEDYSCLRAHETSEVYPNVFHMGRGSTLALPDGRTVLFMGGALSAGDVLNDYFIIEYSYPGGNKTSIESFDYQPLSQAIPLPN